MATTMSSSHTNGSSSITPQQNGHHLNAVYNTLQQQQQLLQKPEMHRQQPDHQQQLQQNGLPNMPLPRMLQGLPANPLALPGFNSIQMAQIQNSLAQMPGLTFPMVVPPQVLQEVFTLIKPVDVSDEPLLIQTLHECHTQGVNYKDALNSLHGRNTHSSVLWKDYYLEHKDRLDKLIVQGPNPLPTVTKPAIQTVKKPDLKRESSTPSLPSANQRRSVSKRKRESQEPRASVPPKDKHDPKRRTTLNSFTTHTPVFSRSLPAPHADLKTPEPPSREPTPPIVNPMPAPGLRGNKYTQEERAYFLKFIGWTLKNNPSLTRKDLCDLLAQKLPHHSSGSWYSYWSNNHDLPDKIYASLTKSFSSDEDDANENGSGAEARISLKRHRPNYKDPSSDEHDDEPSFAAYLSYASDDEDDDDSIQSYSESEMGQQGMAYTSADLHIAAKHMISRPNFDNETNNVRWGDFAAKHPQRAFKSWVEYYRRHEKTLNSIARKLRRKQERDSAVRSSIQNQRARPSWAKEGQPPHIKRKYTTGVDGVGQSDSDSSDG